MVGLVETELEVSCPYCGQGTTLAQHVWAEASELIIDCEVCCRPMEVFVETDDFGEVNLQVGLA